MLKSISLLLLALYFTINGNVSFSADIRTEKLGNKEIKNGIVYIKNETEPYTGKFVTEKIIEEYSSGIKHGFFKGEFTDDGVKYSYEGRYVEGIKHGEWIIRYPLGQKKAVIKYNYDKPYGKWIYFYEDNTLEAYENFKDGVLFGETALFNQKGELITKVNYKEGLLDGKVLFFYGKEKIELETSFINGKIEGDINIFSRKGNIILLGFYKNNKREGVWKLYYQGGELKTIIPYLKGLKNGKVVIYDKGGTMVQTMVFKNGVLVNPDGTLEEDGKDRKMRDNILEKFKKFNRSLNFIKYDKILSEI